MRSKKEPERAIMIMSLYHKWLVQNNARDTGVFERARDVVNRVWHQIVEWTKVHAPKGTALMVNREDLWTPPTESWLKVNVDGSSKKRRAGGGGGVAVGDLRGIYRACHSFANITIPEHT